MELAYIIELNVCAIVIMVILNLNTTYSMNGMSHRKRLFRCMTNANIIFAVSDILTYALNGTGGDLMGIFLQFANMVHIESVSFIGFAWFLYTWNFVGKPLSRKQTFIWAIPLLVSVVIIATNPLNSFSFTISEANEYSRGTGVLLHWAVCWLYIAGGTVRTVVSLVKAPNKSKRKAYWPLILFIVFPAIASVIQMIFYGLSTSQMGISIALLFIHSSFMRQEISSDSLTGLNNRGELENFVISLLENPKKDIITIFLLDLNDFKQINDKYGHVVGDKALRNASSMLRNVCGNMGDRLFLCRYGGDEFVILGRNMDDDAKEKVIANINEAAANCKEEYKIKEDYKIEFGIGMSSGECAAFGDYERILKEADGSMYENKKKMKALRNSNTK